MPAGERSPRSGCSAATSARPSVASGDEARLRSADAMTFPVDLGRVHLDGRDHWFVAHAIVRGRLWIGRAVAVMNAQWLGDWDLGPRAHPDDALLDVTDGALPLGDLAKARKRVRLGTHLPHPALRTSGSPRSISTFGRARDALARRRADRAHSPPRRRGRARRHPGRHLIQRPEYASAMDLDEAKQRVIAEVDGRAELLLDVSHRIHEHPELGYEEVFAHDLLTTRDRRARASTSSPTPTGCRPPSSPAPARRARPSPCAASTTRCPGSATPADTTSSPPPGLGAGLAAAAVADEAGGRVVILGTPAEEGGGGKVRLIDAGAFDGVDAALMVHPAGGDLGP